MITLLFGDSQIKSIRAPFVRGIRFELGRLFAAALCVSIASTALALDKTGNFESKEEQDAFIATTLKKMARELNSQAPIQIDEDTRMMSVIALEKTITFNYRLPRVSSSDVDPNRLAQVARENLNHTVCKSKATQKLIDLGVEYVYLYSGNDGKQISRVSIKSYRC